MSCCGNLLILFITIVAYVVYKIKKLFEIPKLPILEDKWWGPGQPGQDDTEIKPYKIQVSDEVLNDLKYRLNNARPFVPPLEGAKQHYGMNTNLLKDIVDFWKNEYDWRDREKFLNSYPQYTTQIQGLNIHFLHVKPTNVDGLEVVPLILVNGWPSSIREYYNVIPLFTEAPRNRNFVFELIIPSLPGYGFSQGASKSGLGAAQIAVILNKLMERLGFDRYYVHGGDWGATIASNMATLFQHRVLGLHSTMCLSLTIKTNIKTFLGALMPSLIVDKKFRHKMYPLKKRYASLIGESGYLHIQATKPDTVGVGLNDSPVGLAAYILEKYTTGTNVAWKDLDDGGLKGKFTYTELLDTVTIYWVTNCMTTAMRLYAESLSPSQFALKLTSIPTEVPTASANFPHEISYQPDHLLRDKYPNLVRMSHPEKGGHFAALEEPKLFADDIWEAVETFRKLKTQ